MHDHRRPLLHIITPQRAPSEATSLHPPPSTPRLAVNARRPPRSTRQPRPDEFPRRAVTPRRPAVEHPPPRTARRKAPAAHHGGGSGSGVTGEDASDSGPRPLMFCARAFTVYESKLGSPVISHDVAGALAIHEPATNPSES